MFHVKQFFTNDNKDENSAVIRTFFLSQKKYQKRQGKTKLSTRSVIRQESQPKMDKPLRRNSKPYHIHAHAGPQFCRADAHVLLNLRNYFIKKWLS